MNFTSNECVEVYDRLEMATVSLGRAAGVEGDDLSKYFVPLCQQREYPGDLSRAVHPGQVSEAAIMGQFAQSLQNSGRMHKPVGFSVSSVPAFMAMGIIAEQSEGKRDSLYSTYKDGRSDERAIELSERLSSGLGKKNGISLRKYARGLIDASRFLAERNGRALINSVVESAPADCPPAMDEINSVIDELLLIYGLGPALARDLLKECGCVWLAKPDVHLIEVLRRVKGMGLSRDARHYMTEPGARELCDTVFEFAQKAASGKGDESITPYKIDKMIWLLCTEDFYLCSGAARPDKHDLVSGLLVSS